jgi:UDP-N-acetylmuramate--alanine ligase
MMDAPDLSTLGRVHIVGIGGAGMSGIARIVAARGLSVSGSDAKESRRLQALRAIGIEAAVGHAEAFDADTLVYSTAIPESNSERRYARAQGIPELSRAQALAAVMSGFRGVAVSGTHGKTTTTSMLTVTLQSCGADPSFVIGSELNESGSNAHLGTGEAFVVEADESDGSFLALPATVGIVTNIEPDHLNHWGDFAALETAFDDFGRQIARNAGFVVVCADDPGARAMAERLASEGLDVRTYGESEDATVRMIDPVRGEFGWSFIVSRDGVRLGEVSLNVPGRHNALNSLAAYVAATGLGFSDADVRRGLGLFSGTRRRFDFKGEVAGVKVYDDYAHHPTEIAATLKAAREVIGDGRLIVAFQAHHYYRTAMFVREFGEALGLADVAVVLEVFAPGEEPIPGASGQTLAASVPLPEGNAIFEPSWTSVAGILAERAGPGDIVMTLGAGDIGMLGTEVLDILRSRV